MRKEKGFEKRTASKENKILKGKRFRRDKDLARCVKIDFKWKEEKKLLREDKRMKILNIEDTATKHADICKALRKSGVTDIDWAKNLEDGLELLKAHSKDYDLVITDMYYPLVQGGSEAMAGEILIRKMEELQLTIPVIVCSSAHIRMQGILGAVFYSLNSDWERDLQELVKQVQS